MKATRKRIRVLILAAVVAAVIVPVGFALSLESSTSRAIAQAPVAMGTAMPLSPRATFPAVPDAAKLFGLGTLLIALAAAVRRAV